MIDDDGDACFLLRAVHVALASRSTVPEPSSLGEAGVSPLPPQ